MTTLAQPAVIGGLLAVLAAIVGVGGAWRVNQGNYARAASEISLSAAKEIREDNKDLRAEIDGLKVRVARLEDAIRREIEQLDADGQRARATALRTALRGATP